MHSKVTVVSSQKGLCPTRTVIINVRSLMMVAAMLVACRASKGQKCVFKYSATTWLCGTVEFLAPQMHNTDKRNVYHITMHEPPQTQS
jgi:hypothetical protein